MQFARFKALEGSGKRGTCPLSLPSPKNLADSFGDLCQQRAKKLSLSDQCIALLEDVLVKGEALRETVDLLEIKTADELWPLPKYRELLFIL